MKSILHGMSAGVNTTAQTTVLARALDKIKVLAESALPKWAREHPTEAEKALMDIEEEIAYARQMLGYVQEDLRTLDRESLIDEMENWEDRYEQLTHDENV